MSVGRCYLKAHKRRTFGGSPTDRRRGRVGSVDSPQEWQGLAASDPSALPNHGRILLT